FLRDQKIDVLFSHEAPANVFGYKQKDHGSMALLKVIERTEPKLVVCGHHKRFIETNIGITKVVCMPQLKEKHMLLNLGTLNYSIIDTKDEVISEKTPETIKTT
ncbi:MAG: hypothetical protein KKB59_18800, partial [Spirochaetes bacterium]|nr:hypothetical protein [Spirochaetota bacterium]